MMEKNEEYYRGWNDALEMAAGGIAWREGVASEDQSITWKRLMDMRRSWPRIEADRRLAELKTKGLTK